MCPAGIDDDDRVVGSSEKAAGAQNSQNLTVDADEQIHKKSSEEDSAREKNCAGLNDSRGVAQGEGSDDDDTSDPIVVSPQGSPLPSVGDEEIFEDAKESLLPPSPSFVSVGLRRKSTPFSLKSWSSLALTLDGRDKITKVFQYASRMLAWWFASRGGGKQLALRFTSMYKSLANSRKAFRLGRSFIELEKLRSIGLGPLILWHLQNTLGLDSEEDEELKGAKSTTKRPPKTYARRASSNIGWGPQTMEEENEDSSKQPRPSFTRSMSMKVCRAVYRPLRSALSTVMGEKSKSPCSSSAELWTVLGSACKMLGLLGFWAGDNLNYVLGTGFLDDHSLPADERAAKRSELQKTSGIRANQAYFAGSLAGLLVNVYAYWNYCRNKLTMAEDNVKEAVEEGDEELSRATEQLKKAKEKQFSLFLALLKSICDVLVFSNNPGIDLHQKWRGRKNNEGLHCVCGLISAGTVIYNNFPDSG